MKTLATSLVFALTFSTITFATSLSAPAGVPKQPHRGVTYQVGVYGSQDGTKLHVSVNKQTGGRVEVTLKDASGLVLFRQSMHKTDQTYRGKLDVSQLNAGQYQLIVSNGTETTIRPITIQLQEPAVAQRTIALL